MLWGGERNGTESERYWRPFYRVYWVADLMSSHCLISYLLAILGLDKQGTTDAYSSATVMAPIRLRHPKGVSTIEVLSDSTVQDLQQEIYAQTQILPSRQIRPSLNLFLSINFTIKSSFSQIRLSTTRTYYRPRASFWFSWLTARRSNHC